MSKKINQVNKHWGKTIGFDSKYRNIDNKILKKFKGDHPKIINGFFNKEKDIFRSNPNYVLTKREKRQRLKMIVEKILKLDLSRKHFRKV